MEMPFAVAMSGDCIEYAMWRGSACRAQLDIFAEPACEQALYEFPLLYHILHMYAKITVVCRRVECDHSEFRQVSDKCPVSSYAWKCAAVRRQDIWVSA